ncbi:MAG: energy-coupling factor ABC transporter ATP-binding protein [Synergistaceae bacterium]|jgi:energy-coupling factor transport system ATP-binding protein|nr:energy-coupling factor ABC transporter ATP-binding protein [Synergistaceae bacterium]
MLEFGGVHFDYGYGEGGAINGVSFKIGRGEFVALMGENGAGKSTLCRLCNGLLKPSSGRVTVCGKDTSRARTSELARHVGFLFQNPDRQMCKNTVREEIELGLEYTVSDPAERAARRDAMLKMFSLDGGREPFGLSRGERQKVALASVLAPEPEILILDEPTTGLDYRECVTIMEIISKLNAAGTTVLMVSHDMEVAGDYAARALILSGGKLAGDGGVREMMRDARVMESASLLPAQIPALAARVADLGAEFGAAFTIGDMADAVGSARAAGRERVS